MTSAWPETKRSSRGSRSPPESCPGRPDGTPASTDRPRSRPGGAARRRDIDAALAERYGYANRLVPDDQLEEETDRVTRRSASFDKLAIAEIKAFVDAITLPDDPELPPGLTAFFASTTRPTTQARLAALASHGLGSDSELERRLGELVTLATAPPDPNQTS